MAIWLALWLGAMVLGSGQEVSGQCPWDHQFTELQSSCICAYNLLHQLSVQCDMVDFQTLLKALDKFGRGKSIDLLYVNNSSIKALATGGFKNLKLTNLQLSSCKIKTIANGAFDGLQTSLKNLYLQDNELDEVPADALRGLKNLTTLDLSKNRFTRIGDQSFSTLGGLTTLKLSENNLTIGRQAFAGLEGSLKNLNLKATRQKKVPEAVRGLRTLAFLDLAQNALRDLPGTKGIFDGLHSLTALNLERNVIQSVGEEAFRGISDTLSSLSLLNNLLTEFPTSALRPLSELRVLDIGFNLLTELPLDAFLGNPSLTLLALDGNPLSTVPGPAVAHLNSTLRGLSLGGRFLHCDCRLRWIAQWIRRGDLQVTSRERNPQFCGSPPRFLDVNFYNIEPEELTCSNSKPGVAVPVIEEPLDNVEDVDSQPSGTNSNAELPPEIGVGVGYVEPSVPSSSTSAAATTPSTTTMLTTPSTTAASTSPTSTTAAAGSTTPTTPKKTPSTTVRRGNVVMSRSTPWPQQHNRPPLVLGHQPRSPQDVIVKTAHRQDNSVIIQWDSDTANILGFRVVYRLFGDKSFKQGPPLEASEREFKIKNVPAQECIVVCVVSLEEINVQPDNVPYAQCREVRTVNSPTNNMDKITIAASAAICGTVVIAVIIFVATSRRRSRKLHTLDSDHHSGKMGLPVGGLPVACCPASSPGPLSSLATLNAFTSHKDWDQVSVYSNRSLSRPRPGYHVDRQGMYSSEDLTDFRRKLYLSLHNV
ncbi:LRR_TYP [Nesidiocoris tenuis]|uniref:LRR_TYP n=1 Tax=Nesidiocoris tenuis TaxID=355587 RepID=A0ABN7A9G4_9HEMI|nr:LRR_TYP [Nesidiocoris tenuis]